MSVRSVQLVPIDDSTPLESLADRPSAVVVGNFDGVHRGHQAVLLQLVREARAAGLTASVLTFDPHPAAVVAGGAPPLLTTQERRAQLMGELGIERVYVRHFDAAFASWSPDRFARQLLAEGLRARLVVVGENFRFGAKRAGDLALLRSLGAQLGFDAHVHPVAHDPRGPFSSTRAREAIAQGDLDEALRVLGRPHALSGSVAHGDERGRRIGFPTANLASIPEMLPPHGVYGVFVDELERGGGGGARRLGAGVTNIGVRPTVGGSTRTVETHLFDFSGDLYDRPLRLHLVLCIREEKKFGSIEELVAQIGRDAAEARQRLALVPAAWPVHNQPS